MKNYYRFLFLMIIVIVLVSGINIVLAKGQNSKSLPNDDLTAAVKNYMSNAKYNHNSLQELLKIAERAKYNHDVIKTSAYFLSKAGFNTMTVMIIARLAGNANHKVKHLNEILEISIIHDSESLVIVGLARKAVYNEINEAELIKKLAYYRKNSTWKTIDEAIEKGNRI